MNHQMMQDFCIGLSDLLSDSARLIEAEIEIERLRGLLGEPLRVIAVEAIREATGCPDIKGNDGEYLTDKLMAKANLLLTPNAKVTGAAPTGDSKSDER